MGVRTLGKGFYLKLAWANVRRSREVYLPYMLAAAIIGGVYFLVVGLSFADKLAGVPGGETARAIFAMGVTVFTIFAFFFLLSINRFLIKRRKKEFGLYGVLGLSKSHVGRILLWENAMVLFGGLVLGIVFALVLGKLLFLVLLKLMRALPSLAFTPSPLAYVFVGGLFLAVFVCTSAYNLAQVHLANPIQLMQSERRGERDGRFLWPKAALGLLLLGAAYFFAWVTQNKGLAIGIFFILVLMVIAATYLLFNAGSIAVLRLLRSNKGFYYKPSHFVNVSGMFHRMRQNASSLATICILSTMLTVTLTGTLSLYLGQEQTLRPLHPFDVAFYTDSDPGLPGENAQKLDQALYELAQKHGLVMVADQNKLTVTERTKKEGIPYDTTGTIPIYADSDFGILPHTIFRDNMLYFDLKGDADACLAFIDDLGALAQSQAESQGGYYTHISDIFTARQDGYGIYGGLLFLGAFFSILFLSVTVLMLYFKQITEGYEDKDRFAILQKVGMDQRQVKRSIDSQVLWVFFLPLAATLLHMVFASRILTRMLEAFMLSDWMLVLSCAGGVCLGFALLYLLAYKLTARVYYRIVRW